jgi:oligoribonuclease NrnB/cAMP/cGMP phosphodiesterase (DHH superfamily)
LIYVLHHTDADGFGAAYAAWTKYKLNAVYIPVDYGLPVPDIKLEKEDEVYILDFAFKDRAVVNNWLQYCDNIVLLDHHESAYETYKDYEKYYYSNIKCGAEMAWEYFRKRKPMPLLISYIADWDLWKWELPFSKDICNYVCSFEQGFLIWDAISFNMEKHKLIYGNNEIVKEGAAITRANEKAMDRIIKNVRIAFWDDWRVNFKGNIAVLNTNMFISEIGNRLCLENDVGFSATYYDTDTIRKYSLRSTREDVDVSKIAKFFGGGGHFHAAGYETEIGSNCWKHCMDNNIGNKTK